jgi:hypothetical protein|nr:MAG TPA: hypothetical protein [Caudoviricetes sp.]
MDDKNENEKLMEELKRIGEGFNKFIESIGEALNELFYPKEDDWEMKCPYEDGDEYYLLDDSGSDYKFEWDGRSVDKKRFSQGNAFQTKEAAELESKRRNLLTRFKAFRDECNGDWKPDWSEQDSKYFLCYSQKFDILSTNDIHICERFHTFGYFKTESDARKSIKLFGDEIIELFVKSEGGENENNQRNKRR